MSHAALVNDGLLWLVLLMTLLLAMFVFAVVVTPPQEADRSSEEHPLGPPASPPPASVAALPSRRPPARRHGLCGQAHSRGGTRDLRAEGPQRPAAGAGARVHPGDRRPGRDRERRVAAPRHQPRRCGLPAPALCHLLARVRRAYRPPGPRLCHRLGWHRPRLHRAMAGPALAAQQQGGTDDCLPHDRRGRRRRPRRRQRPAPVTRRRRPRRRFAHTPARPCSPASGARGMLTRLSRTNPVGSCRGRYHTGRQPGDAAQYATGGAG
jgi:hypothetical protein